MNCDGDVEGKYVQWLGLVVLSTYLGLAGMKEARRGVIRAQAPTYLFKITQDTSFLAKKSEAKKIIYEPALVSGN